MGVAVFCDMLRLYPQHDEVSPMTTGRVEIEERPDYLYIRYIGDFGADNTPGLLDICAKHIRQPGRVWNLVSDFREAEATDRRVTQLLSRYAKENKAFVDKSAVLGLSGGRMLLLDIARRISGRNLRPFNTLEEAEAWMQTTQHGAEETL